MNAEQFYQSRRDDWQSLTDLLDQSERRLKRLSPAEVADLSRLYRAATADLALAQRDYPQHRVTQYLNQLVARAHAVIYSGEPLALNRIRRFATTGFPRTYRRAFPFILAAALLFILPGILTGLVTNWNPSASTWLLPPQVQELIPLIEEQELWTNIPVEERPYTSAFIMRNNIQVVFLSFAGGMLAGLLTL